MKKLFITMNIFLHSLLFHIKQYLFTIKKLQNIAMHFEAFVKDLTLIN